MLKIWVFNARRKEGCESMSLMSVEYVPYRISRRRPVCQKQLDLCNFIDTCTILACDWDTQQHYDAFVTAECRKSLSNVKRTWSRITVNTKPLVLWGNTLSKCRQECFCTSTAPSVSRVITTTLYIEYMVNSVYRVAKKLALFCTP